MNRFQVIIDLYCAWTDVPEDQAIEAILLDLMTTLTYKGLSPLAAFGEAHQKYLAAMAENGERN